MKKLFLLFIFYLSSFIYHPLMAQEIMWQNTIGGNDNDEPTIVRPTSDGGFICGGYSASDISGDKTENNRGAQDYWVLKLDSTGNIQWQKTIGGDNTDLLLTLIQSADGGYVCGGSSMSDISGEKNENSLGITDYWVVKLDGSGNMQWQNTIGGNFDDQLASVCQTQDGGYILGGYSNSGISGDKTEGSIGIYDYWIVKIDANGNIQWQNTIGGNTQNVLKSIRQSSDGGYICAGSSNSPVSGDKTEASLGGFDFWIIKLDNSGNILWQNTIGGSGDDFLYTCELTGSGSILCGGSSNSNVSGDKTENSQGVMDYWILQLSATGNIEWQNTIGGATTDNLLAISHSYETGILLVGTSRSNVSGDKTEDSKGGSDYWLLKLDSAGVITWQKTLGGSADDDVGSGCQLADGSIICAGGSASDISGDKSENSQGLKDYWILKLDDDYNSITGLLYVDANSNNVFDFGENPIAYKKVMEINTNNFTFSGLNGEYTLIMPDTGTFTVESFYTSVFNTTPLFHYANFNSLFLVDSLNHFAYQPAGIYNDLCVTLTPVGLFRSGMSAYYNLKYENVGTTDLTPTVIFYPDNEITFVSSQPLPDGVTNDSIFWNLGTLNPYDGGMIQITVTVNFGVPIGTLVNSTAFIEPLINDFNPACNYSSYEILTTGSFDPNDILVNKDSLYSFEFPNPPFLDYIVRFQNTGNDTAFTVKILNSLDSSRFDISSMEFIDSSHPVNFGYVSGEHTMRFLFDNILLPDSNINEPESHGFVRYRIKPLSSLLVGDSILNRADIYFDFNQPVSTNVAVTEIVLPTGISQLPAVDRQLLNVYPNPVQDEITVVIENMKGKQVIVGIYDVYGRPVKMIYDGRSVIDVLTIKTRLDELPGGIYFVRMDVGSGIECRKIVKY